MYEMVTARVPAEIRRQGNAVLKSLQATPTQLINAAYDYVIKARRLPGTGEAPVASDAPITVHRTLDPAARQELCASIEASTLDIPESFWGGASYKDLIAQGRRADYEALA